MRNLIKLVISFVVVLSAITSTSAQYHFIELPSPTDGNAYAYGISNDTYSRTVAGRVDTVDGLTSYAYLAGKGPLTAPNAGILRFENGHPATLGGSFTEARAFNDSGLFVGRSFLADNLTSRAFSHQTWTLSDLGVTGVATNVNNAGTIVIQDQVGRSYIYDNGLTSDLGTLTPNFGGALTFAEGINEVGTIVGRASQGTGLPLVAFSYQNGQFTTLGVIGGAFGDSSEAYAINDMGLAVGRARSADGAFNLPCYFQLGTAIPLITDTNGIATDVNNVGEIVGTYETAGSERAFIFKDGQLEDLHQYMPGWSWSRATGINNEGWITGYGLTPQGKIRSWLLAPLPYYERAAVSQDSYILSGQPNKNPGDTLTLRVRQNGKNRALIMFHPGIGELLQGKTLLSAKVRLFVVDSANWGSSGRYVGIHRLNVSWVAGNVTWNSPSDDDTSNNVLNGTPWEMTNSSEWPFEAAPTSTLLHTNSMSGWVEYDVTADVQAFIDGTATNHGWIIKKVLENQAGSVEYASQEYDAHVPELVLQVTVP